jgi:hypothetical protein
MPDAIAQFSGIPARQQAGLPQPSGEDHHTAGSDAALWSPHSGAFNGPRLRRALVARGWTAQEFAASAGITSASIYSALRSHRVRDRTAIKIFRALARREPTAF